MSPAIRRALPSLALAGLILAGSNAGAAPPWRLILGQTPPDTASRRLPDPDSLDAAGWADRGYVTLEDLADRLAGADQGRIGVEGVFRPVDIGGPGRGRLPLELDGLPAGGGVIHWDNHAWVPLRALSSFAVERTPAAGYGQPGGGGRLSLSTSSAGERPASIVALTGGSFGHRLAELDFARRFGAAGFHADVADLAHDGFGAFSAVESRRGFLRLDFPLAGFAASGGLALASGGAGYVSDGLTAGREETGERRLALQLRRRQAGGDVSLSLLHHRSRIEIMDVVDPFSLSDGLWRLGFRMERGDPGWFAEAAAARETREGVLDHDAAFESVEAGLGLSGRLGRSWIGRARCAAGHRDPTGIFIHPSVELGRPLGRSGRLRFQAGRTSGLPGLVFHQGGARPELEATSALIEALESREKAESHSSAGAGLFLGGRLAAGLFAGAVRTEHDPGPLLPGSAPAPIRLGDSSAWTGQVTWLLHWQVFTGALVAVSGAHVWFEPGDHPFRARLRGEAVATLTRLYFERDLDLAMTGFLRLTGSRRSSLGEEYPEVLTGGGGLTGRIRNLTLFLRIENAGGILVETDLVDASGPIFMPGIHTRLGATLRLVD